MEDNLEKFIKNHRSEFDDKVPREALWDAIRAGTGKKAVELKPESGTPGRQRALTFWKVAAAVLLLVTAWLVYDKVSRDVPAKRVGEVIAMDDQLNEAESFYVQLINEKKKEVIGKASAYGLDRDFIREINTLDSMYNELKTNLTIADQQNVKDAIILNLQLRIKILNEQLKIIQSIENQVKDEKVTL